MSRIALRLCYESTIFLSEIRKQNFDQFKILATYFWLAHELQELTPNCTNLLRTSRTDYVSATISKKKIK